MYFLSEEKYRKFSASLLPGTKNILGVRLPYLRKLAKEILKLNYVEYIDSDEHIYFEEIMLCGMIIGYTKDDVTTKLNDIKNFLPKIDNWSVCDSFCNGLKFTRKNKKEIFEFLQPYFYSNKTFEVRFALVMLLNYYVEESYLKSLYQIFDTIVNNDYYVEMALAWAISNCYIKYPEQTIEYLKKSKISNSTYKKTIQKICDSKKVNLNYKNIVRKLVRD